MKLFKTFLLLYSLMGMATLNAMEHNGTDIDESGSENEPAGSILPIAETGWYLVHFAGLAINKGPTNEELNIILYVHNEKNMNDVQKIYRRFAINAHSNLPINDHIPVILQKNQYIELKFKAPHSVDFKKQTISAELLELTKI